MAKKIFMWMFLALIAGIPRGLAHQTSESYLALSMTNGSMEGRWAIALHDLNHVLAIDADQDGEVTDEGLSTTRSKIEAYAFERLKIQSDSKMLQPRSTGFETVELSDAFYATLLFRLKAEGTISDLSVTYTLFNDIDPLHRGLFRLDLPGRTETAIFSPAQPAQRFLLGTVQTRPGRFANFVREGVWHIWTGYDHWLFLIALLLPSVLEREGGGWRPARNVRVAMVRIIKVVTAFTVAHSITLAVAALGWVELPGRVVESVIAASVVLAALNNVKCFLPERIWLVAFGFGLIHGFGFASVLAGLELGSGSLAWTLFGFNLGVELGQVAIVAIFVPLAFAVRRRGFYEKAILRYGSLMIAALSMAWLVERALDRKLLPF